MAKPQGLTMPNTARAPSSSTRSLQPSSKPPQLPMLPHYLYVLARGQHRSLSPPPHPPLLRPSADTPGRCRRCQTSSELHLPPLRRQALCWHVGTGLATAKPLGSTVAAAVEGPFSSLLHPALCWLVDVGRQPLSLPPPPEFPPPPFRDQTGKGKTASPRSIPSLLTPISLLAHRHRAVNLHC